MDYHRNARTNKAQREEIQSSSAKTSELADRFCTSENTIRKWKSRATSEDNSSKPHKINYALTEGEQEVVRVIRIMSWFSADQLVDIVKPALPKANKTNISRTFVRLGINKKPKQEIEIKNFKQYEPGFIHMDVTYIPKLEGTKKYLFVAIDRATRIMYIELKDKKSQVHATEFLENCCRFFPFKIQKILTDNGSEFTNKMYKHTTRKANTKLREHDFDRGCRLKEIEHRTTQIKHPWTNGMVERANRLLKENTIHMQTYANYSELEVDVKAFEMRYNLYRRHGSLNRKTPYQQLIYWYEKMPKLFRMSPQDWSLSFYATTL